MSKLEDLPDRELDALFAEKVLGCPRPFDHICGLLVDPSWDAPDGWTGIVEQDSPHKEIGWLVPDFTRSLDAAWKGVEKLDAWSVDFTRLGCWQFNLGVADDDIETASDSPARAVVLACLKAKGVEL